jgi:hypothetical protein
MLPDGIPLNGSFSNGTEYRSKIHLCGKGPITFTAPVGGELLKCNAFGMQRAALRMIMVVVPSKSYFGSLG